MSTELAHALARSLAGFVIILLDMVRHISPLN